MVCCKGQNECHCKAQTTPFCHQFPCDAHTWLSWNQVVALSDTCWNGGQRLNSSPLDSFSSLLIAFLVSFLHVVSLPLNSSQAFSWRCMTISFTPSCCRSGFLPAWSQDSTSWLISTSFSPHLDLTCGIWGTVGRQKCRHLSSASQLSEHNGQLGVATTIQVWLLLLLLWYLLEIANLLMIRTSQKCDAKTVSDFRDRLASCAHDRREVISKLRSELTGHVSLALLHLETSEVDLLADSMED